MSGLINDLIEEYSNKVNKNKSVSQAKEDGFVVVGNPPQVFNELNPEFPCCSNDTPCKHWIWDQASGEGYINSLSGRKKVVI